MIQFRGKQYKESTKIFGIELVNFKSEMFCLSEDTIELKETKNNFSSKLIVNELVILASETPSTKSPTINTAPHEKHFPRLSPSFEDSIGKMSVNRKKEEEKF